WVLILSVLMQAIYLAVGFWSVKVLCGNLISAYFAVFNFLLMGMTVQNALKKEEKDARQTMRFSQSMRMLMLFLAAGAGVFFCDPIASVVPLFFPRVAVGFRPFIGKKNTSSNEKEQTSDKN
ncbi:MAG: hypothetical protein IIT49_04820, partial [Clostridia bacterium]|nr:hypothetical protein [Clostridia bacterium]